MIGFTLLYFIFGVVFTFTLSWLLLKYGSYFLKNLFPKQPEGAKSLIALLQIGFYLINFGYIFLMIAYGPGSGQESADDMRKFLTSFVGWQCLLVGVLHMINMAIFSLMIPRGGSKKS